jgi:hypothetical protein
MRIAFRTTMFVLQIPLWITAVPALGSGAMDSYRGDTLWLPSVGTFMTFYGLWLIVSWPIAATWEVIKEP